MIEHFKNIISNRLSLGSLILWFFLALSIVIVYGCTHNSQAQNQFSLGLPIQCSTGENCFILLYSDRDPSEQARDFNCGFLTYNGHKGTDFAITDTTVMEKGIPVIASADGVVLRTRDGVEDKRITSPDKKIDVEGKECGNGVVIDHGDGWQTQYCHLRKDSVQVKSGQKISQGETLGFIGMSGLASFPHVHLTLTHDGQVIDPFVGLNGSNGSTSCDDDRKREPLWNQNLPYKPTGLIRAGFSSQPPKMGELWDGEFTPSTIIDDPPMLLFWSQVYGVMVDDEESMELIDPQGNVVAQSKQKISQRRKLWLRYIGKRAKNQPFIKGKWRGKYQLKRSGKILVNITQDFKLG